MGGGGVNESLPLDERFFVGIFFSDKKNVLKNLICLPPPPSSSFLATVLLTDFVYSITGAQKLKAILDLSLSRLTYGKELE